MMNEVMRPRLWWMELIADDYKRRTATREAVDEPGWKSQATQGSTTTTWSPRPQSAHKTLQKSATVQPVFEILNFHDVCHFRLPDLDGGQPFAYLANPLAAAQRSEGLSDSFVKRGCGDVEKMATSFKSWTMTVQARRAVTPAIYRISPSIRLRRKLAILC